MDEFLMVFRSNCRQGGTKEGPNISINWKQTKNNKREDEKLKKRTF
jgi:hypothetical protein